MVRANRFALMAVGVIVTLFAASPLRAEPGVYMAPVFGHAIATADDVSAQAGDVSYRVDCPDDRTGEQSWMQVGVHATTANPITVADNAAVVNAIIIESVRQAYVQCPTNAFGGMEDRAVGSIEILAPPSSSEPAQPIVQAGHYVLGIWESMTDVAAAKAAQAQAQAQQQAQQEQAAAAQQAQAAAQQAAQATQAQSDAQAQASSAASAENVAGFLRIAGRVIEFALGAVILRWLFSKRQVIARWYFFTFHPHPAAPMVQRALASSTTSEANARALADALGEIPPGSSTLRGVRLEQAERLYRKLHEASVRRQREIERRARANAAQAHEEAAHYGMQDALALAAVALERAKAAARAAATYRG